MMKQFKVIVPSFNCPDYLRQNLASIEKQTYKDFQVCVIDDGSTLQEHRDIAVEFCRRNNWKCRIHDKNYGALYGMVQALRDFHCDDDDVVIVIDGDDWLAHEHVFEHLHKIYTQNDVYLTWGQCEKYPFGSSPMRYAQPVPDMIIEQKLYRDIPFVFWHPVTFKYLLWRNIKDEDLRDINGQYFRYYKDKATIYPMVEMAGRKIMFIPETLTIYNLENPLNDYRTAPPEEFERVNKYILSKPRYKTLENLQK